jgi:hypothetical protein
MRVAVRRRKFEHFADHRCEFSVRRDHAHRLSGFQPVCRVADGPEEKGQGLVCLDQRVPDDADRGVDEDFIDGAVGKRGRVGGCGSH